MAGINLYIDGIEVLLEILSWQQRRQRGKSRGCQKNIFAIIT
jgi:hypothetical protein